MSRSQRDKGKRGELEVVHLLRTFWPDVERNSHGRRQLGVDFVNGPPGCVIDAKLRERLNVQSLMRELEALAERKTPILFHRSSREPWRATLPAEELAALLYLREAL